MISAQHTRTLALLALVSITLTRAMEVPAAGGAAPPMESVAGRMERRGLEPAVAGPTAADHARRVGDVIGDVAQTHVAPAVRGFHLRLMDGLRAHIAAHPRRARLTGYVMGGGLVVACPHGAVAYALHSALGAGVLYHTAASATVAAGVMAGGMGADVVLNGRESDLLTLASPHLSDDAVRGFQAAAVAVPAAGAMVLLPGVGILWMAGAGALHSVPLGAGVIGGASVAAAGAGGYYGVDGARPAAPAPQLALPAAAAH